MFSFCSLDYEDHFSGIVSFEFNLMDLAILFGEYFSFSLFFCDLLRFEIFRHPCMLTSVCALRCDMSWGMTKLHKPPLRFLKNAETSPVVCKMTRTSLLPHFLYVYSRVFTWSIRSLDSLSMLCLHMEWLSLRLRETVIALTLGV